MRILAVYDAGKSTREEVAKRFRVSLGFVKKLLCQRKRTGKIEPKHHNSGRRPTITQEQRKALRELLVRKPDATLEQMKAELAMPCTPQAIHYVLESMELTYKKRRCAQASKTGQTSARRASTGNASRKALIQRDWSSSTSQQRKRT